MRELKKIIDWFVGECKDWRGNIRSLGEAAVVVIALSLTILQNYMIPTGSMMPKLMPGDRLFANRFLYGMKVPFTDGFEGLRLPKIKYPNRGDIIIFRAPPSADYVERLQFGAPEPYFPPSPVLQLVKEVVSLVCLSPFASDPRITIANYIGERVTGRKMTPMMGLLGLKTSDWDPKKEYVKRVIAVGGETVDIINKNVYINGELLENKKYFRGGNRGEYQLPDGWGNQMFDRNGSPATEGVKYVESRNDGPRDNLGPIYIPKMGETITFAVSDEKQYKAAKASARDFYFWLMGRNNYTVLTDGKDVGAEIKPWLWINFYERYAGTGAGYQFTVKEPFYFAMGDNRNNSLDSRFWGPVHFSYIKGQPNLMYWPIQRAIFQGYVWIH